MTDDAHVLIRVETEVDRGTVARRQHRGARRPPRRSDRWWALGVGVLSLAGLLVTGPGLLWWLGLAATALFLLGDALERRAIRRALAAIPPGQRRRVFEIGGSSVTVTTAGGEPLVNVPWSEVDEVRRSGGIYTIVVDDVPYELPLAAFPSELTRGSFEALAARNDRPVRHE